MFDIYWANSLFSASDRDYNKKCVFELRNQGFSVFLPQEAEYNIQKSPSDKEIFENDTAAIKNCKIFIACIDQETIDCGVACEIGIAFMMKKPIIGLYTDIRKNRTQYRMYKNPYIIGAIKQNGSLVCSISEMVQSVKRCLK